MTTQFAKSKPHCIAVRRVATLRQICRNTNAKKSMHVCNIYIYVKKVMKDFYLLLLFFAIMFVLSYILAWHNNYLI